MSDRAEHAGAHVAVIVAAAGAEDLRRAFANAVSAASRSALTPADLCPSGREFAHEIEFLPAPGFSAKAFQAKLEAQFGAGADVAVLPAEPRRKELLISDMDSTIIAVECLDELAAFAGKKQAVAAITERAMAGELDFDAALEARVAMLAGLPLAELEACLEQRIRYSPGAATLIATLRQAGVRTVLVSGGFTFFTQRIAEALGFDAHFGNTLIDDGTHLTGKVGAPILGREAKLQTLAAEAAGLGVDAEAAMALGDGANDLDMIQAAGLGIAYRAQPIVSRAARCAINVTSLRTALYFQGYREADFASPGAA
ncbi:MAG: phosphoserine phosphatase SerB [Pseudomonadota bacterium]